MLGRAAVTMFGRESESALQALDFLFNKVAYLQLTQKLEVLVSSTFYCQVQVAIQQATGIKKLTSGLVM